jgi:hypothetical protein
VRIIGASSLMMDDSFLPLGFWPPPPHPCVIDGFLTKQQRCQHQYMGFGRRDREREKDGERSA